MSYVCLIFPVLFISLIILLFYLDKCQTRKLFQIFKSFCENGDYEVIDKKGLPELIGTYKSIPFKISYYKCENPYTKCIADLSIPCDYNLIISFNEKHVKVDGVKPLKLCGVDMHKAFNLPEMILTGDEEFDKLFFVATRQAERLKPIVNELINSDMKTILKEFYDKYKYIPKIELKDHYLELQDDKAPRESKSWNDMLNIMEKFVLIFMKDELPSGKEKLSIEDKKKDL